MGNRSRYRQAAQLYVTGKELELKDGSVIWCQVLNDFEVSDARRQAAASRARYSLAMKQIGSDEYDTLRSAFDSRGRDLVVSDIMEVRRGDHLVQATNELEADSEWKERYEILNRSDEIETRPADDPERALLTKVNEEWIAAVNEIVNLEQERLQRNLSAEAISVDDLFEEYRKEWLERRSGALAMDAYNLREVYLGARCCDAIRDEDGSFGPKAHEACKHVERAFETEEEVRELPAEFYGLLREAFDQLSLTVREAKN